MLSDWLSADGRKADEKMGCARYDRGRLALCLSEETADEDEHWFLMGGPGGPADLPDDVALALHRDRAREWLLEHGARVNPYRDGGKVMYEAMLLLNLDSDDDGTDGETVLQGTTSGYTDYDSALIGAVLATEVDGKDREAERRYGC